MTKTKAPAKKNSYHHGDLASELLKAAESELAENGIEAFSLRAVAKRAGVSHGAPAHHFTDARGLLTALAAVGYERLVQAQKNRQRLVSLNSEAQLMASGLGYIDFATQNPALFRLIFSSEKPDRANEEFTQASILAFNNLVSDVQNMAGSDPYSDPDAMKDVMASWAMVHGLADLMISGRTERPIGFSKMPPAERDAVLAEIMRRAIRPKTQS